MRKAHVFLIFFYLCCVLAYANSSEILTKTADFRDIVQQAKNKVFPTVVYIKCVRESFDSGKKLSQEVSGSGVIISGTGEILTNWHVIEKAINIRCLLNDGQAFDATLVGSDKDTDLALVQLKGLDSSKPLPYSSLGESATLKEGDFVMAMGAPWGLSRSVSIGIISCTQRYLPEGEYSLWLQTDASICPGNSGGPLVNTNGQVVGINTLGNFYGGDMGFSIPSDTIKIILPQFQQYGKVNWSWLGLQLQPLKDFNKNVYFEAEAGVIIAATDPDSPASQAGLKPRDIITHINGQAITALTEEDLPLVRRSLGLLEKGKPVELTYIRNDEPNTTSLVPTEKGNVQGEELDCPRWDLTVKTINQFENPDLYFYCKQGVFIYGIKYPGNAENSNLREQDIILKIDGTSIKTLKDVQTLYDKSLESLKEKHRCVLTIMRNGLMQQIVLDYNRDYDRD